MSGKKFDYIIVGAGSAGCVLANRLSADPANRVLLLEAGGRDLNPWIHIPVGYFKTMHDPRTDWCYVTDPDPGIAGRSLQWPRGKVLGGSSSLNGLLYVRGQHQDYDRWRDFGNPGWGYDDVLPYFIKSEDFEGGRGPYHGVGGPQKVSFLRLRREIAERFIEAAVAVGIPRNEDYNGADQEGVAYFYQTATRGSAGAPPGASCGRRRNAPTWRSRCARKRPRCCSITAVPLGWSIGRTATLTVPSQAIR